MPKVPASKKRLLLLAVLFVVLALLLLREMDHWQALQWGIFWRQLAHLNWTSVAVGLLLFYVSFFLRAWRWKIFLRGSRRTTIARILGPTFIGFTALALLGGPAELSRPYLIAKKEQLTVTSQLGVWTLERLFDIASFALLLLIAIFFVNLRPSPYLDQFRRIGLIIVAGVGLAGVTLLATQRHGARLESLVHRSLSRAIPRFGGRIAEKLVAFGSGIATLRDGEMLVRASAISLLMWGLIVIAYFAVIRAFPLPLRSMPLADAPLLIAFAVLGSFVQLPGGATSELMMIGALLKVFHVPAALAVSCGIALWLGAYMAPVPIGLLYLRHEHLSLRAISRATPGRAEAAVANLKAPDTMES
ncbi:MAG TPA: lysylphosphatidylglycerol synthase transmembrane domain-containing protein [Candidatus Acidoferrales bacterium]|nr:lysylphosphatidylglycerol synthase transmembrane domain-containing protein [Candidatus Acidoferrales bacterium]